MISTPQHLVSALNMLVCLRIRGNKARMLHTLNGFRAIQRRIALDLQEMGTRDRALGDSRDVKIKGPVEGRQRHDQEAEEEQTKQEQYRDLDMATGHFPKLAIDDLVKVKCVDGIDVVSEGLVDINKYRFAGRFENIYKSSCPTVPVYHQTFG